MGTTHIFAALAVLPAAVPEPALKFNAVFRVLGESRCSWKGRRWRQISISNKNINNTDLYTHKNPSNKCKFDLMQIDTLPVLFVLLLFDSVSSDIQILLNNVVSEWHWTGRLWHSHRYRRQWMNDTASHSKQMYNFAAALSLRQHLQILVIYCVIYSNDVYMYTYTYPHFTFLFSNREILQDT